MQLRVCLNFSQIKKLKNSFVRRTFISIENNTAQTNNPQDFNKQKINALKSYGLFVRKWIFSIDIMPDGQNKVKNKI